jgi:hypothetical protein
MTMYMVSGNDTYIEVGHECSDKFGEFDNSNRATQSNEQVCFTWAVSSLGNDRGVMRIVWHHEVEN